MNPTSKICLAYLQWSIFFCRVRCNRLLEYAGNCGFGHTRAETEEFCMSTQKLQWRSPSSAAGWRCKAMAKVALPQRKFTAAAQKSEESPRGIYTYFLWYVGPLNARVVTLFFNRQVVKHRGWKQRKIFSMYFFLNCYHLPFHAL